MNDVLTLLLAAVLVVSIFRYLKVSTIIGYLMAGLAIGPYALAFVRDIGEIKTLGHLGVVFLLFSIGLKLPLRKLQGMKNYFLGLGGLQFLMTGFVIGLIAYSLGQTIEASILIGSGLALSSTAVGLGILSGRSELTMRYGRVAFAVLLFQDFVVIVLLVLLTTLGQPDVHLMKELGISALKAGIVLSIIILVGRLVLRPVYQAIATLENQELFVAMTLLVVLATSMTTESFGLSMELGAFLAGLLLSETEYRHQEEADIEPFYGLLLGLFFMTVGMSIDLRLFSDNAPLILGIILSLILGKTALFTVIGRLLNIPKITALRAALLLAGGGEFVFIIFTPAMESGIIPTEVGQILFVSVAISMALTPLLDSLGRHIDIFFTEKEARATVQQTIEEIGDLKNHVIILGFGRVGKMLAAILAECMVPFVAIDKNMKNVTEGRLKGWPVFYGDARRVHVLRAIGAENAKIIVINLSHNSISRQTALMTKRHFKNAEVCVRLRDDTYKQELNAADISVVVPENLEPSLQLASSVLEISGTSVDEIHKTLNTFREVFRDKEEPLLKEEKIQEERRAI